jgi:GWxTD domain-containing protein
MHHTLSFITTIVFLVSGSIHITLASMNENDQSVLNHNPNNLNQKQLLKSKDKLEDIVKKSPNNSDAWFSLAHIYAIEHEPQKSVKALVKTLNHSSDTKTKEFDWDEKNLESNVVPLVEQSQTLSTKYQSYPEFLYELADAFRAFERSSISLHIIDNLKSTENTNIKNLITRARIYFDMDSVKQGLEYYWQAVKSIQDTTDAKQLFKDLYYITTDTEYSHFKKTPVDSMEQFFSRFWNKRDPNLETKFNERIGEHYKRLTYAEKHFTRRSGLNITRNMIITREHPLRRFTGTLSYRIGDDLLKEIGFPKAIPKDRTIDDLGLVYIRHGEPDQKVSAARQNIDIGDLPIPLLKAFDDGMENFNQMNEWRYGWDSAPLNTTWKYKATYNRSEMIFHFCKRGNETGWIIESIPTLAENRESIDPSLFQLKRAINVAKISEIALDRLDEVDPETAARIQTMYNDHTTRLPSIMERINKNSEDYIKVGLTTETSDFSFDTKPLDFRYIFASFKGPEGKNELEMYYAVEGRKTTLVDTGANSYIDLKHFMAFHTPEGDETIRMDTNEEHKIGYGNDEWAKKGLLGKKSVSLEPGMYNYEVRIKDNKSQRLGVYKGEYENENYFRSKLMISDVLLLSDTRAAKPGDPFYKEGIAYTPRMFSDFRQGETVGVYFEIYNLTYNSTGKTDFKVEYTLRPHSEGNIFNKLAGLFKSKGEKISLENEYDGNERDEKIYQNFDLSSRTMGTYELIIQVKDNNADNKVIRKVMLNIKS